MKMLDRNLQSAAEAAAALSFPRPADDPLTASDFLTALELERLLATVRDAIAAPVLALHEPWTMATPAGPIRICLSCHDGGGVAEYPCPTVRALSPRFDDQDTAAPGGQGHERTGE